MTGPTDETSEHDPDASHDRRHEETATTSRDRTAYQPNPERRGRLLSAGLVAVGLWFVATTVALGPDPAAFWNAVLVGVALAALGAYDYARRANREFGSVGVAAFAAILGLWTVISPFVTGLEPLAGDVAAWNATVVGLLALGLGGYGAVTTRNRRRDADARGTATYDRRGQ